MFKCFRKEYFLAELDFTKGSACEHKMDSKIPTKIRFKRKHNGKTQKGFIKGKFTLNGIHNIIFLIKRGEELSVIDKYITDYEQK